LVFSLAGFSSGNSAGEPATNEDPIVTQSYVDWKVSEIKGELDINSLKLKIADLKKEIEELKNKQSTSSSSQYEILELRVGKKITFDASTEFILRAGKAKSISSDAGGLVDLTSEKEGNIKSGDYIPLNHLILVPRDDGRGIIVTSNAWIMVKGKYQIK
jgi:hypothetical protein